VSRPRPAINLDNIPLRLKQHAQWVVWRFVLRKGKQTKVPFNARTGGEASVTDPERWSSFEEAVAAWRGNVRFDGIGFVFSPEDPFGGVDLDNCLDPSTGLPKEWAEPFLEALDTYCEVSPSGTGLKLFMIASKTGERCSKGYADGKVEVYDEERFFTVTGNRIASMSGEVEERQVALDQVYATVFGPDGQPAPVPAIRRGDSTEGASGGEPTDEQIVDKARRSRSGGKFSDLWAGNWQGHFHSHSEADSSLVFRLAFYTKDPAQVDRLFRASGLMRDKWDERHGQRTYGQMTIDKALTRVTAHWQPGGRLPPRTPAHTDPRQPQLLSIVVSDVQLDDLTGRALGALTFANEPPTMFVRVGSLCRVVLDEEGVPVIQPFDKLRMRGRLAQVARFHAVRSGPAGPVRTNVNPPLALAENLVTLGQWPSFPPLSGIAHTPILHPDGTICTTPGYDRQSTLLYCPSPDLCVPPVPDHPTPAQLGNAVASLRRLIQDFPFADRASHANALAILFSLLMRPVIRGHVPMAVVVAPVQGTGKTLLVSVLATVAVGRVSGESVPARANEDEWRKKVTSILLSAAPFVLLDNIPDNSTIDAPALAAALTSHEWSDRLLGGNQTARLPARAVWVATGNNLRVAGDMPRRCYTISLDANAERPWERGGFGIPDLEQYARERRGELLAAAFTVIRAWYAAGRPAAPVPAIGSFQEWAQTVGSVLAFAGIDGFLGNLSQTRSVQDLGGPVRGVVGRAGRGGGHG
jgi:hypothetical protein